MTSRDFAFWLQGKLEGRKITDLTQTELEMIPAHLNLVFKHEIDPGMGDEAHQEVLNEIHHGTPDCSDEDNHGHGTCPHEGWVLSTLHGWYDPSQGIPRC